MQRKITIWIFLTTNWRDMEDWDMAMKGKPQERNRIFSISNAKQRHKDQLN